MKRKIDLMITTMCLALIFILYIEPKEEKIWPWICILAVVGLIHLVLGIWPKEGRNEAVCKRIKKEGLLPEATCTELVLLSEEGSHLASWNMYGKNGIVIGRDIGENQVTVDLNETAYAGMIDVEHAVLNFSGNDWYVEDVSSKNGISIQKRDGRKYKLSYGKPCKVERFDILFIGLTRLQIL